MHRLYLQIYATFLGIIVLFAALATLAWWATYENPHNARLSKAFGGILREVLPPADASDEELQAAIERLGKKFEARFTLRTNDGRLIGAYGDPLDLPSRQPRYRGWGPGPGLGPVIAIPLPDQRLAILRPYYAGQRDRTIGFIGAIGLLMATIAIGAYPLAKRLTGRLMRLQLRVNDLGAGDLDARIDVEGTDEVAELARSFNRAAERIQKLVSGHKDMLASASHELRSPLTRVRMAIELLADHDRAELRDRIARDIAELDELIEELLIASRLDYLEELQRLDEVDLLALAAEEANRIDAEVSGTPVTLRGDRKLLRRLLRNLLENARRYGEDTPIEVELEGASAGATIRVLDRGPGIPPKERERVFQPFYRRSGMREGIDRGVGLGLALVRQIAARHGGEVTCRDREGGGTCFEVTFGREQE